MTARKNVLALLFYGSLLVALMSTWNDDFEQAMVLWCLVFLQFTLR